MSSSERQGTVQIPERPHPGQIIFHGTVSGRITLVDRRAGTVSVEWEGGSFPVVYPITMQEVFPWER
jgi:hypothetical protein